MTVVRTARRVLATGLVAGVVVVGAVMPLASAKGGASGSFVSIFSEGNLKGAGWAACPTAIVWDADVSELSERGQANALSDLEWALSIWGSAAGIPVSRGATGPLKYDNGAATVQSPDGSSGNRKIYVKFVQDKDSTYLSGRVVGVATPTNVIPDGAEIVGGSAAFRVDYVEYANKSESRTLLLHELGHALGLGHSKDKNSVMYPIVTNTVKLASGDVAGIRAFTKECNPAFASMRGQ